MITRSSIEEIKKDLPKLYSLIIENSNSNQIGKILEYIGHIPQDFNFDVFLPFLKYQSTNVRFWAVKNIGKAQNPSYLPLLCEIAKNDSDSMVRREAVSSIGRMRNEQVIPVLISLLDTDDPKIILQAIRGLLFFKQNKMVCDSVIKFQNHPNEIIRSLITQEFSKKQPYKSSKPHPFSDPLLRNVAVLGDVRDVLNCIPDESIHLTFTSPPYYNARDYSIYKSYEEYLDFLEDVFSRVHRITKEGRFFILNTSPIIIPRVSRAHSSKRYPIPFDIHGRLVNNGWEFIDDIVWLKPETAAKNRNAGFMQHRKPLGYKPNAITEYLMVYRKQTDKLLDWNMHQYDFETIEKSKVLGNYETSNVWRIDPAVDRVHTAVFPIELCNRVIKFYSYKYDLVFDPFGGSGTFAKAAMQLGRYFFITEKEPKYFKRIQENLSSEMLLSSQVPLFLDINEFQSHVKGRL